MFHFTTLKQQLVTLIGISFLRMLGIFLILPIISLSAIAMEGSNEILAGLALGGYGITQALMQIPIGLLADRWGKKRTLLLTLSLFTGGSLIAAMADDIILLIVGRILQGCGAVSTVIVAWISDITEEKKRPQYMAFFGASIGISFALSLIIAPIFVQWADLPIFFIVSATLGGIALLLTLYLPSPSQLNIVPAGVNNDYSIFYNPSFKKIIVMGFILHYALSGLFFLFPQWLVTTLPADEHWKIFSSGFFMSLLAGLPLVMFQHKNKFVLQISSLLMTLGVIGLFFENSITISIVTLFLFFSGFVVIEALLPALVTKISAPYQRGLAVGTLLSAEFLGIFAGGLASGFFQQAMSSRISLMIVFSLMIVLVILGLQNLNHSKAT